MNRWAILRRPYGARVVGFARYPAMNRGATLARSSGAGRRCQGSARAALSSEPQASACAALPSPTPLRDPSALLSPEPQALALDARLFLTPVQERSPEDDPGATASRQGRSELSPAIHRWVRIAPPQRSPVGTAEIEPDLPRRRCRPRSSAREHPFSRPSGTAGRWCRSLPSDESLGYTQAPLRGSGRWLRSLPRDDRYPAMIVTPR
jgi:hypothetical protein